MNQNRVDLKTIWRSKLSQRLIPLFVAVVAVPVAVTIVAVGRVAQDQIVATANTIESSNLFMLRKSGKDFRRLNQTALQKSGSSMTATCLHASRSLAVKAEKDQADSIKQCGLAFANLAKQSSDRTMLHSLSTEREILNGIDREMDHLFANSAQYTQARVGDRVQSAIIDQINSEVQERANHLAGLFDSYIITNMNYLRLTAQMLSLDGSSSSSQLAILKAVQRSEPDLEFLNVLDMTGRVVAVTASNRNLQDDDRVNQAYSTYFKKCVSGQQYVGVDQLPVDGRAPIVRLAFPIESNDNKVIGIVSACLSLDDLWTELRRTRIGKYGYAYVRDENGIPFLDPLHIDGVVVERSAAANTLGWQVVVDVSQDEVMQPIDAFEKDIAKNTLESVSRVHQDIRIASHHATCRLLSDALLMRSITDKELAVKSLQVSTNLLDNTKRQATQEQREMQKNIQTQIRREQRDNDRHTAYAESDAWTSLAELIPRITSDALDTANRRLICYALIILVVSSAISCFIGFMLAGAVLRPIIQLSKGTRALAKGDLNNRVDERAPAEIGDLAVSFNTMAASLQKSRADLTEAEAQLIQSAKLASLGTLSAGVAHELNQPVAIVRGLAQQLKADPSTDPAVIEDLAIIERQSGRMMKIINHLRTFCRSGGCERDAVNVNQVITDCFILIDAQLRSHGVKVDLALSEDELLIFGDRNELEQVFINLITNARDAMEGRPQAALSITSTRENNSVRIEVRDNGPGIPDDLAKRIFDPFFTTKEVGKGTGLGLSISHGIIETHQGSIVHKNDNGAVFTITLPLVSGADSADNEEITTNNEVKRAA